MTEELTENDYEVLDACCELQSIKIEELKTENDRLKQTNKELAHYLACMTEQRNRANTCLQEIKKIAEKRFVACSDTYCDKQIKTKECNPRVPCNAYLLRKILQLTKAEEE